MRLIDADSLIEAIGYYIGKKIYASYPNDKMPDFDKGMIDGYARARSIVFETPTVDPVTHETAIDFLFGEGWLQEHDRILTESAVKHGRWDLIDACEPMRYGCSVCHRMVWHHENYCPHCGAKMDEEEQDDNG